MVVDDVLRELRRLHQALVGREPPELRGSYLAQPYEGRPVWPGTTVPVIEALALTTTESGLYVPQSALAGPAPIDGMAVYLTANEVLRRAIPPEHVRAALGARPAADFLLAAAHWLGRLEGQGIRNLDLQLAAAEVFFVDTPDDPARTRVRNLITRQGHRLLAPQPLLAVMKAALLASPPGPPSPPDQPPPPLMVVMLGLAQALGAQARTGGTASWGGVPEQMALELVRNQYFNVQHNLGSLIGRYQRLWHDLPAELAGDPGALDLAGTFEQVTGVRLDHLLLVAFALGGSAGRGDIRIVPAYLQELSSTLGWSEQMVNAALALLAVDEAEMRRLVAEETTASGFDWAYTSFRRYPLIRLDDGSLVVTSARFLHERVTGGAAYWELDQYYLAQGEAAFQRFRKFYGKVVERYVRDSVQAMVGSIQAGVRRVWCETDQQAAWTTRKASPPKACDLLIDYGNAWVAIEIVSGRLTQPSVTSGTSSDFDRDVGKLIEDKVRQLDATIRNLDQAEEALTGRPRTPGRRIYPIVLVAHGFPVNPWTMDEIHRRVRDAGLLQGSHVARLEIIDLDQLEQLEALAEDGGPVLPDLLASRQRANLRLAPLDQYLAFELGVQLRRPDRLSDLARGTMDRILNEAGIQLPAEDRQG
jgi:hypothetical protein